MKYAVLLKRLAAQLGEEVQWSAPRLVDGSINPPPSLRYPGLTCYVAQVRVGCKEYSGFGRSPVAARHFVEYKAYMDLYFTVQEKRARERESVSVTGAQNVSTISHSSVEGQQEPQSQSETFKEEKAANDINQQMMKFARKCHTYFLSNRKVGHCCHGDQAPPTVTSAPSTTGDDGYTDTTEWESDQSMSDKGASPLWCDQGKDNQFGGGDSSTEVPLTSSETVDSTNCSPTESGVSHDTMVRTSVKGEELELVTPAQLTQNPIGQLQELLMQEDLPLPTYHFSSSPQPQNGLRSYQCLAKVKGFIGEGLL